MDYSVIKIIIKKENNKKENNSENNKQKKDTIIKREKFEIKDSIKNKQIIDKSSFDSNKKRKSLNNKVYNTSNKVLSNKKKEQLPIKANSLKNIKNSANSYKTQYNNFFKNKKEKNDLNYNEGKLSTERRIKNIQKIIKYNNKKIATLSEDEIDNSKNKTTLTKIFENISINANNINHESKNKNYENLFHKNKIHNLKKFSLFNRDQNIPLDSKNNLFLNKLSERNTLTENEENKNINYKNKDFINLYKYKKEPILISQKITNINYPNEQMKNKIKKKEDIFQEFFERHKLKLNISSDYKSRNQKNNNYEINTISNRMYGARSNIYYNKNNNYRINDQNILLKKIENNELNLAQSKAKKIILKKNKIHLGTPKNINYKLISFNYNFNSSSKNKINKTRNAQELILPITNIFKTFQVNKYKHIINNISDDFSSKIVPVDGEVEYSLNNKKIDNHNNIKNINIYTE